MLTKDELERAEYEDREKARRDALSWERERERNLAEIEQSKAEIEQNKAEIERLANQCKDTIRTYEHILGKPRTSDDQLSSLSADELSNLANSLREEVLKRNGT